MAKIDITKIWALNYRLVASVIGEVAPDLREFGIECKELFLLAELDAHPHPAADHGIGARHPSMNTAIRAAATEGANAIRAR